MPLALHGGWPLTISLSILFWANLLGPCAAPLLHLSLKILLLSAVWVSLFPFALEIPLPGKIDKICFSVKNAFPYGEGFVTF